MDDRGADAGWERRHPGGDECWSFDFRSGDGALAGFVALTLWGDPRPAWYWAALVGAGRPYLLVRDLGLAPPRSAASREVRGDGLWADVNCETPHDHWSVGLEAFGVALDDPDDALGDERGHRTGLGLDLEWEAAGPVVGGPGDYAQACRVHGEVLVGAGSRVEASEVDGLGWRRHAWGRLDWTAPRDGFAGFAGSEPVRAEGPPAGAVVVHRAPLRLGRGAGAAVLERTLCRLGGPGVPATGWRERVVAGGA